MKFLRKLIPNALLISFSREFFTMRDLLNIINSKFAKSEYFIFKGQRLKYFYHSYNNHRLTERAIEIPIVRYYLNLTKNRSFLEIGNVSNHYYTAFMDLYDHKTVIDKYEKGCGVINNDIKDFTPEEKFHFIFSISTFEHMDSDRGRNQDYIKGKSKLVSYAADNIMHVCENLLEPQGYFIITAPMGYSKEWDDTLFINAINAGILNVKSIKIYFFKKINEIEWKETDFNSAKKAKYGSPLPGVNILSVVEIIK